MLKKRLSIILLSVFALFFILFISVLLNLFNIRDTLIPLLFLPKNSSLTTNKNNQQTGSTFNNKSVKTESNIKIISDNLNIPWGIVFISKDTMLVTERPGNLLKVTTEKDKSVITKIEGVVHRGEGGLLGITKDPQFETNKYIYVYLTAYTQNGLENRVERYKFENDKVSDRQGILTGIRGSSNHDGGFVAFGPDGYLYVTTGDAENPASAQDTNSLNGKILRIKSDGSIPDDNPFNNAVYSYGHRNVQGLAWDSQGRLWATEHGPSGAQTGNDEINLIVKGKNYGWPTIKGQQEREGMETSVKESGSSDTWAPGQIIFYKDSLFFTGLRGSALYQAKLDTQRISDFKQHFKNEYGRLRATVIGPDGYIYMATSNRDGRGRVNSGDDKIIRINPEVLIF